MNLGLYIHIPFCQQKCFYCDFPSYANIEDLQEDYVTALRREIAAQGGIFSAYVVDTIYIGGGTPTVLSAKLLKQIIAEVKQAFVISPEIEWTIEVNPGTVDGEKLTTLFQNGVNRLSFGVQSFNDHLLKGIGRIHDQQQSIEAINLAEKVGFQNMSLDLMYGLPQQTMDDLRESMLQATKLPVKHISIYGLKVEPGTVFAKLEEKNQLALPSEEVDEAMYELVMSSLPQYGYQRYEISNFARSGFESKHNLKYWQDQPYLGLGASAHSYFEAKRFSNVSNVKEYMQRISTGVSPQEQCEKLDPKVLMEEFCFLALRTKSGIDIEKFDAKFSSNFFYAYGHIIDRLKTKKLIEQDEKHIYLTELGMKYGNQVFCEFLLD
ncbi:MAG: oxygen-independent coproporphyrinogen oxidase [Massilibacillus sp.]|jgi:oxygen-independent coproporphyrinogen-3 oxidase|nr:oxygen-independent coproporphyrinogen oxidase [Massilibacillus sp.]